MVESSAEKTFHMKNSYIVLNGDTDSLTICNHTHSPMSEEEQSNYLKQLNSLFPEKISWAHDGYFRCIIVLRAKNYILDDGKKVTYKGSAVKAKGKEPALQELIKSFINVLLYTPDDQQHSELVKLYTTCAKEIANITDIKRWSSRKTISATTLSSERANETKIVDAIEGSDYVEGDRIYVYFKEDGSLGLAEKFDGNYDRAALYEKLFKTTKTFESVLPVKELFINYSLKKNLLKVNDL